MYNLNTNRKKTRAVKPTEFIMFRKAGPLPTTRQQVEGIMDAMMQRMAAKESRE